MCETVNKETLKKHVKKNYIKRTHSNDGTKVKRGSRTVSPYDAFDHSSQLSTFIFSFFFFFGFIFCKLNFL